MRGYGERPAKRKVAGVRLYYGVRTADLAEPTQEFLRVASAAALMAQGHHAEALEGLDHAFAAGADDATFWMARGDALRALGRKEEAAAAFDQAIKRAPQLSRESIVLVSLSGRGDKDLNTVLKAGNWPA
jgi:tetratricopeptide (TPR) repeat protein